MVLKDNQLYSNKYQEDIMKEYKIAVIVGSLRKESFNQKLANAVAEILRNTADFYLMQPNGQHPTPGALGQRRGCDGITLGT